MSLVQVLVQSSDKISAFAQADDDLFSDYLFSRAGGFIEMLLALGLLALIFGVVAAVVELLWAIVSWPFKRLWKCVPSSDLEEAPPVLGQPTHHSKPKVPIGHPGPRETRSVARCRRCANLLLSPGERCVRCFPSTPQWIPCVITCPGCNRRFMESPSGFQRCPHCGKWIA